MAWQTAPGMIVIIGGFSLVGAMFAGVDGLANWIYKKVRVCVCSLEEKERVRKGGDAEMRDGGVYLCVILF